MDNPRIQILDVVALTSDSPEHQVTRGQVGTVVEILGDGFVEVEFSDDQGRTFAQFAVAAEGLLRLRYEPTHAV